ncbi:MAG: prepilin-type N-terminal cleavage/methylation domain-containing protein [Candidatus Riflebacteria bacterium]|nr:prepilin-type N-terminal cleavage/methylation domain-containing protein [Candidatus Riflebacteria bacterium]
MKKAKGFSLVEILVALSIASLFMLGFYRFLFQYSRSYLRIIEKAENVAEVWQVFRYLNEDICNSDFLDGDCKNWSEYLKVNEEKTEFSFYRRHNDKLQKIVYHFDSAAGSLKREDETRSIFLLKDRCKLFSLDLLQGESGDTASMPGNIGFKISLEAGRLNSDQRYGPAQSFSTYFFPVFANMKLKSVYNKKAWPLEASSN